MQATDTITPEAQTLAPIEEPLEIPPLLEDRPRWGFTLGCAVASLCILGLGFLKGREAPLSAGFSPPPSSGGDLFAEPDALDTPAVLAAPLPTTPAVTPRTSIHVGQMSVSGRLPPEVIGRVLRQQHGRVRLCYEHGLRANPALQGRVGVRFVIGRDGAVSNVSNGGSDLPSADMVSCVVRAFYGVSFPQPAGGIVTVTYPISFSPRY